MKNSSQRWHKHKLIIRSTRIHRHVCLDFQVEIMMALEEKFDLTLDEEGELALLTFLTLHACNCAATLQTENTASILMAGTFCRCRENHHSTRSSGPDFPTDQMRVSADQLCALFDMRGVIWSSSESNLGSAAPLSSFPSPSGFRMLH